MLFRLQKRWGLFICFLLRERHLLESQIFHKDKTYLSSASFSSITITTSAILLLLLLLLLHQASNPRASYVPILPMPMKRMIDI